MALTGRNLIESIYNDRALLIESDPRMRSFYEDHLEFSGFEVHCANTLAEANNVLEYLPVNLIIANEFLGNDESVIDYIKSLREKGMKNAVILLTENEDRVWEQISDDENILQIFPLPEDLETFLKSDINQFVSMVGMAINDMHRILVINDSPAETVELENLLINNYFRVRSVRDGKTGLDLLRKSASEHYHVDLVICNIFNCHYPGLMFLAELAKDSIDVQSVLLTSVEASTEATIEEIKEKTHYEVSKILSKTEISDQLIPSIQTIISNR